MHRKRMTPYVLASALTLAGCAGGVATDRTFSVFFDRDSATLDQPARDIVDRASDVARASPRAAVTVQGYAQEATPSVNMHLSTDRADVVTASLVANGVDASRVRHAGNGISADKDTGVSNRRVDIAVETPVGKP